MRSPIPTLIIVAAFGLPVLAQTGATGGAPGAAAMPYSDSFAQDSRVFELRTYHANPGKLDALNARFREHTNALFEKHGMTLVAYWRPVAPPTDGSGGTLIYVLAYPSVEARDAAWKAFTADPEWIAVRDASEREGKLLSKIDSVLMKATDYSKIK
jgi:hypothetical protein